VFLRDRGDGPANQTPVHGGLQAAGLYSSHLVHWRRERRARERQALTPRKRGPKVTPADARDRRIAELERENRRLEKRVAQAEQIIEIQKKVSTLLGISLPDPDESR
jgi:transposase